MVFARLCIRGVFPKRFLPALGGTLGVSWYCLDLGFCKIWVAITVLTVLRDGLMIIDWAIESKCNL